MLSTHSYNIPRNEWNNSNTFQLDYMSFDSQGTAYIGKVKFLKMKFSLFWMLKIGPTIKLLKPRQAGGRPRLLLMTEITSIMLAMSAWQITPGLRLSSQSQWSCQGWPWSNMPDVKITGTMFRSEPRMSQQVSSQLTGLMTRRLMGTLHSSWTRLVKFFDKLKFKVQRLYAFGAFTTPKLYVALGFLFPGQS